MADENAERALRALRAVDAYRGGENEPLDDTVADLLTDLRHLCEQREMNFVQLLERSIRRYDEETG